MCCVMFWLNLGSILQGEHPGAAKEMLPFHTHSTQYVPPCQSARFQGPVTITLGQISAGEHTEAADGLDLLVPF